MSKIKNVAISVIRKNVFLRELATSTRTKLLKS